MFTSIDTSKLIIFKFKNFDEQREKRERKFSLVPFIKPSAQHIYKKETKKQKKETKTKERNKDK